MAVKLAFVVLLLALVGTPQVSHAEKAKVNQATSMFNRKGEAGKVLVKLKAGQVVNVLKKDGRWLQVRAMGRRGWVPQTTIDIPNDGEIARNTRRRPFVDGRSTDRGFSGNSPEDRVGADATEDIEPGDDSTKGKRGGDDGDDGDAAPKGKGKGKGKAGAGDDDGGDDENPVAKGGGDDDEGDGGDEIIDDRPKGKVAKKIAVLADPEADSEEQFTATSGMTLYVGETKGKYTFVENDEGDAGYVLTSALEVEEVATPEDGGGGGEPMGPRGRQIDVRGRLGVTLLSQGLKSGGAAEIPDNYKLSTSAATLAVGAGLFYPYGKRMIVGGELSYAFAKAIPGIKYQGKTTGITIHDLNVRGIVGYDLQKKSGMMVMGRLGLKYNSFQVGNVTDVMQNNALLPSEIFYGPAIGVALALPRLTEKIGARLSLDTMLFGTKLSQTKNLEDGASPKAKAACIGLGMTYRWKKAMDLQATYDLNYVKAKFGDPPANTMRAHPGASRTDISHAVTVGVGMAF